MKTNFHFLCVEGRELVVVSSGLAPLGLPDRPHPSITSPDRSRAEGPALPVPAAGQEAGTVGATRAHSCAVRFS